MSKDYSNPNVDDEAEERKKDSPMVLKKEAGRTKAVFKDSAYLTLRAEDFEIDSKQRKGRPKADFVSTKPIYSFFLLTIFIFIL